MKKIKEAEVEEKNELENIDKKKNEVDLSKKNSIDEEEIEEKKLLIKQKDDKKNIFIFRNKKYGNYLLVIVVTIIICTCLFGLYYKFFLSSQTSQTTKLVKDVTVTDSGIADAVEKVYDSVVVIKTYARNQLYSTGTGFVFKSDDKYGYILTNSHVISSSSKVELIFTNNKTIEAEVVGSDEYSDIAVLRVEKENIILIAQTGSSESMRVGDTTFAVGAPIDSEVYSWSVTRGILSGKDRLVESDNYIMEVLQTDTAINSGNSGGPLCNSNGEVIGITNMKLASSSIEGMGFAIPIETALEYANSIISGKSIQRPYLGVSLYNQSNSFFNSTNSGIYIESVEKNSAAYKAGLEAGDKIIKIGDVEVSDISNFKYQLYKYKIGEKVKIIVERNEKEKEFTVTLASNSQKS